MTSTHDTPRGDVVIQVSARTDVGRTREHNEDAFVVIDFASDQATLAPSGERVLVGPHGTLLMVADGMGGAAAGEIASAMATETLLTELRASWSSHPSPSPDVFVQCMSDAANAANAKIHQYAAAHPDYRGMGTTATIAGVLGNEVYIAQVGDSRAYLVRNGTARQITKDQSLMQKLIEAGELTEEEAAHSERRNIILQALGPEPAIKLDITHQLVRRGDVLVLCSDGLSGQVSRDEIGAVATRETDTSRACETLIDMANRAGGPDNITVIVARFDGAGLESPDSTDPVGHQIFTAEHAVADRASDAGRITVPIRADSLPDDDDESIMGVPVPPVAVSPPTTPVVSTARRRMGRVFTVGLLVIMILGALWFAARTIRQTWHLGQSRGAAGQTAH